jgi:hypothetical protein
MTQPKWDAGTRDVMETHRSTVQFGGGGGGGHAPPEKEPPGVGGIPGGGDEPCTEEGALRLNWQSGDGTGPPEAGVCAVCGYAHMPRS